MVGVYNAYELAAVSASTIGDDINTVVSLGKAASGWPIVVPVYDGAMLIGYPPTSPALALSTFLFNIWYLYESDYSLLAKG